MQSLLLAAALATLQPATLPPSLRQENGAAEVGPESPGGRSTAPSSPAADRGDRLATGFTSASGSSLGLASGIALPAAALIALAAAGLVLARRRSSAPRFVQVVETAGLGAKRSLVVARLGQEVLLLGVSEAGVSLLATRPAPQEAQAAVGGDLAGLARRHGARQAASESRNEGTRDGRGAGLLTWLRPKTRAAPPSPAFDACLVESTEDQELRRKLAQGLAGSVR